MGEQSFDPPFPPCFTLRTCYVSLLQDELLYVSCTERSRRPRAMLGNAAHSSVMALAGPATH